MSSLVYWDSEWTRCHRAFHFSDFTCFLFYLYFLQPLFPLRTRTFLLIAWTAPFLVRRHLCEGEVTLAGCTQALKHFKWNKSPGLDGLPYEFLIKIWDLLGPDLVATFNDSFSQGSLSFLQGTRLIKNYLTL